MLQPRKFRYKTRHKRRLTGFYRHRPLSFGNWGLRILQPLFLTAKQIFRLKLFLKKAVKKSEFTRRFAWVNIFPHLPLSKKVKGTRMGKGVGKLSTWHVRLNAGIVLLEFKNLRLGRMRYFFKQVTHKLPIETAEVCPSFKTLSISTLSHSNYRLYPYW